MKQITLFFLLFFSISAYPGTVNCEADDLRYCSLCPAHTKPYCKLIKGSTGPHGKPMGFCGCKP